MNKHLHLAALLLSGLLTAAFLAPAQAQNVPIETYSYNQTAASQPYASGLRILAAPNASAFSLQYIPANTLADLNSSQVLTNKTINCSNNTCTNIPTSALTGTIPTSSLTGTLSGANMLPLTNNQGYLGNASSQPVSTSYSAILDAVFGSTEGNILQRGASSWGVLAPGSAGQLLTSGGAGALNSWTNPPVGATVNSTSTADVLAYYAATGNTISPLTSAGTASQVLTSNGPGVAPSWQNATGGTNTPLFVGTTTNSGNAYTMAATTPSGFTLTNLYMVCGPFNAANTGAATLNVNSTGAIAIKKQTDGGLTALGGGELFGANQSQCLQYNSTAAAWILQTVTPGTISVGATSQTLTQAQWSNSDYLLVNSAGQTFTLPQATTLSTGGAILIGTVGVTATLQPNAADGINGTAVGTAITLPANRLFVVTTTAADTVNAFAVPLGTTVPISITYTPGINPNGLPIANISQPHVITGIRCTPEVLTASAATISVVKAASGTALSSGTVLHSGSCNAFSGAATDQNLTLTVTTLNPGDRIGITTTGTTAWTSGSAAGVVTVFIE